MKNSLRRRVVSGVATLGVVAVVAACGSASGGSTGDGSANPAAVAKAKADIDKYSSLSPTIPDSPLPGPPPADKSVVFMANGTPNSDLIGVGVEQAAKILGWKYTAVPYKTTPEATQAGFDQAIALKPDVIFGTAAPPEVLGGQRAAMKAAGIAFVDSSNVYPAGTTDPPIGLHQGEKDENFMGRLVADVMIADSGARVKAAHITIPQFTVLAAFQRGIEARFAELCPETCTLKQLDFQVSDIGTTIPSGVVSELQRDPDINYLTLPGDFDSGLVAALRTAGLDSQVKIVGFAPTEPQLQQVKDGTNLAWVAPSQTVNGMAMVHTYLHFLAGADVPFEASSDTDPYPMFEPKAILTADNIGQLDIAKPFNVPANYADVFAAMWHAAPA